MTTQHDRRVYRDGPDGNTPIVAADLNVDQDTLVGLCMDVDVLSDAIGNVGSGTTTLIASVGTSAERGAPTLRRVHFNTDTHKPEFGWGDSWRDATGAVVAAAGGTGGGGTASAPQNARAVVNTDNSIDVAADPVSGATSYNLYELRNDPGTILATSSSPAFHRTPGGTGTYGYWITDVIGGTESAASNIAYCSLPYGTTPSPGGGSTGGGMIDTPSEILRLGDEGGHWSLDVGRPTGNVSIDMSKIEDGYSEAPYYRPDDGNTTVFFKTVMNGGTTSGSAYPRVELRERNADGSKAAWNGRGGTHILSCTTALTHFPPNKQEAVVGQIHDTEGVSSSAIGDRLQIRVEGTAWYLSINGNKISTPILTGYSLGTFVAWEIRVSGTTATVKINGSTKYSANPNFPSTGCYFKVGNYAQTSTAQGNPSSEYVGVKIQQNSLVLSHS